MDKKIIPITFSCDDGYVKHISVVMVSILENGNKSYNYDFILFDNGIKDKNKNKLKKVVKKYKNARLRCINILDKTSGFLTTNIKSTTIFDRLFVPEILTEYDKVIQLDADMVVVGDISELYNEDIEGFYIGAVRDRYILKHIQEQDNIWLKEVEKLKHYNWESYIKDFLKCDCNNYFNAGMMLMNLKKMRQDKISDKLVNYLIKNQPLALCDQDALNAAIGENKKLLSPRWNFVADFINVDINDEYCKEAMSNLGIIHKKLWVADVKNYSSYYNKYLPSIFKKSKLNKFLRDLRHKIKHKLKQLFSFKNNR